MANNERDDKIIKDIVLGYLRRAMQADEDHLARTSIPKSEYGWRSSRALQVAAIRAGAPGYPAVRSWLAKAVEAGTIKVRANVRPTNPGDEYRLP